MERKRTAQAYGITEDPTRGFNYAKAAIKTYLPPFEAHPAGAANTVLLYHSLNDEVDTHAFIQNGVAKNGFYSL